jgi:hypothetical protein
VNRTLRRRWTYRLIATSWRENHHGSDDDRRGHGGDQSSPTKPTSCANLEPRSGCVSAVVAQRCAVTARRRDAEHATSD